LGQTSRRILTHERAGRRNIGERDDRLVAAATDDDLARGTEDDWGLGQVAVHLLLIDRASR
jgi:hypothetical protein